MTDASKSPDVPVVKVLPDAPAASEPPSVVASQCRQPRRAGPSARERSPRRKSPAAPLAASSSAATVETGSSTFGAGQQVVLRGLVSRPDLDNSYATVLFFDSAAQRYAVQISLSGEKLRVREFNLKQPIFGQPVLHSSDIPVSS